MKRPHRKNSPASAGLFSISLIYCSGRAWSSCDRYLLSDSPVPGGSRLFECSAWIGNFLIDLSMIITKRFRIPTHFSSETHDIQHGRLRILQGEGQMQSLRRQGPPFCRSADAADAGRRLAENTASAKRIRIRAACFAFTSSPRLKWPGPVRNPRTGKLSPPERPLPVLRARTSPAWPQDRTPAPARRPIPPGSRRPKSTPGEPPKKDSV